MDHPAAYTFDADHVIVSKCGAVWQDEWAGGARVWRPGPDKNPWDRHEVDYYMDVARELGYKGATPDPEVLISVGETMRALNKLSWEPLRQHDYVCISAAYLKSEHWPLKHAGNELYTRLAVELDLAGENVVFVGGSDDWEDANKIIMMSADTAGRIVNLCGYSSDIKDTAVIVSGAKLVVGNDGGLMHISAAVGTKTVTVFTFTNPVKNRPYCNGEVVMVECEDRLTCQHGQWSRCGPRGCLNVPFDAVWEKTKIALASLNQNQ